MTTKLRTEILVHAKSSLLEHLLSMLKHDTSFTIIEDPHYALVMMKMRDTSQQSLFYSGEVLVTQSKVKFHDQYGLGIIIGMQVEKSLLLAKIDAVFKYQHAIIPSWTELIMAEKQRQDAIAKQDINQLLNTKVEFQTMDKPYEI